VTPPPLDAWIAELASALGVDPTAVNQDLVLNVSKAAHGVSRGAAPLTTFLVGLAAGLRGGSTDAITWAARTALHTAGAGSPPDHDASSSTGAGSH
jgi:hypothetical protein